MLAIPESQSIKYFLHIFPIVEKKFSALLFLCVLVGFVGGLHGKSFFS